MKSDIMQGDKVGQKLPSLAIRDKNGRRVHLEQFKGAWLLLVFHRHLA